MSDRRWTIFGVGIGVAALGTGLIVFQGTPYKVVGTICIVLGLMIALWGVFGHHKKHEADPRGAIEDSGNSTNDNRSAATGNIVNIGWPTSSAPPPAPITQHPEKPEKPPLASQAKLLVTWFEGAAPVIQVENRSNGPVECRAMGQIIKAEREHKKREPFRASWRDHHAGGDWVRLEPRDRRDILIATHVRSSWGMNDEFVTVHDTSAGAEVWNLNAFAFADVFYEIETRPATDKPYSDWNRLTWNKGKKIFELAKPLGRQDD